MRAVHGRGSAMAPPGTIVADVLDAWFPPCPEAIEAMRSCDPRHSPEVDGRSLIEAIAYARGIDQSAIALGAGSSDLIHRALPRVAAGAVWGALDPTYSEYAIVAEAQGRRFRRLPLDPSNGFAIDFEELLRFGREVDALILVNPNNPVGSALTRDQILDLRDQLPPKTTLWVDEAYVDYAPGRPSVERDAMTVPRLFVVKSMSKAYALSGLRAAYLVGAPSSIASLASTTPPWLVSGPAQAAASAALRRPGYYDARYGETRELRRRMAERLRARGLRVFEGDVNAVLVATPKRAVEIGRRLEARGVLIRTPEGTGQVLGDDYIRAAVVDPSRCDELIEAILSEIETCFP